MRQLHTGAAQLRVWPKNVLHVADADDDDRVNSTVTNRDDSTSTTCSHAEQEHAYGIDKKQAVGIFEHTEEREHKRDIIGRGGDADGHKHVNIFGRGADFNLCLAFRR